MCKTKNTFNVLVQVLTIRVGEILIDLEIKFQHEEAGGDYKEEEYVLSMHLRRMKMRCHSLLEIMMTNIIMIPEIKS